ncbi:hypothetical protein BLA18110_01874 [Burkholderia lata]|uniref:hypothetical protein n=1 Tax=Burkholderia lata (strain ATCC 17760 / DSM 23089 / LMG 22485 / NCIMB 9086 / R18194 / 383) TaxID=482957 RepID=UPI001453B966|nr:hypothetical protein [Burkholderia lata]VWC69386.1 hypothetical protein BLA18110_01874 [Burkholderia lata]
MKKLRFAALAALSMLVCAGASASDFDGSKPLLCATIDAHACDPGLPCARALPADLGAPRFLTIDFAKKTIAGPARSSPIQFMEKAPTQIAMQGTELGYAWTLVLDTRDGTMTATLVNRDDAVVVFGNCMAK